MITGLSYEQAFFGLADASYQYEYVLRGSEDAPFLYKEGSLRHRYMKDRHKEAMLPHKDFLIVYEYALVIYILLSKALEYGLNVYEHGFKPYE